MDFWIYSILEIVDESNPRKSGDEEEADHLRPPDLLTQNVMYNDSVIRPSTHLALTAIITLALLNVGCKGADPTLAAVSQFISANGKVEAYGGSVINNTSIIGIDSKGISIETDVYKRQTPNRGMKTQSSFSWKDVGASVLDIQKDSADLLVRLQPSGTTRFQSTPTDSWRHGPAPTAEFSFRTKDQALQFHKLFVQAAIDHGAGADSKILGVSDNRTPPSPSAQKAQVQKFERLIKADPSYMDRVFPKESPR